MKERCVEGARGVAHWLKAVAALPEDCVQFPAPMLVHSKLCNTGFEGALKWPSGFQEHWHVHTDKLK